MDTEELQVEVHAEGLDLTTGPHEIVVHLGTGGDVSRQRDQLAVHQYFVSQTLDDTVEHDEKRVCSSIGRHPPSGLTPSSL